MCRVALSLLIVASFAGVLVAQLNDQQIQDYIKYLEEKDGHMPQDCRKSDLRKEDIQFLFYTRKNFITNVTTKDFDFSNEKLLDYNYQNKTTKFLIHGWHGSSTTKTFQRLIMDYIWSEDVNVISMDWSVYSTKCNLESVARDVTTVVGEALLDAINYLVYHGSCTKTFQMITFGVGAHIAAVAAKATQPPMRRITALEPTGLLWDFPRYPRLEPVDFGFVDVIFTTGNHSSARELGHIQFYPEGGQHPQPGCENEHEMCSAYMSISYFRRSIVKPQEYPAKKIDMPFSGTRPRVESADFSYEPDNYMGEFVDPFKHGKYYVNVRSVPERSAEFGPSAY